MTNITHSQQKLKKQSSKSVEYILFFTLIFVCAIPFATVRWILNLYQTKSLAIKGPLALAWLEAHRTTPVIFSV
jgi:uncharacterized membrane protein YcjF (UPF0283 family)